MPDPSLRVVAQPAGDVDLVTDLLVEALRVIDGDAVAARRCIESACILMHARDPTEMSTTNLLADWQVRRAKEFIHSNLGSRLRIETVAKLVDLSASYFARAFKATMKVTFCKFVTGARIDLAKSLLLTTETPISEIALMCGLADQAHLTRLFGKAEGLPPRAWRRRFANSGVGNFEEYSNQAASAEVVSSSRRAVVINSLSRRKHPLPRDEFDEPPPDFAGGAELRRGSFARQQSGSLKFN